MVALKQKLYREERKKLLKFLNLLQNKLIPVAPKAVIEVDTKADLSRYGSIEEYSYEKTQDLLNSGIERVIWIFTKTKKVMIAERNKKWIVQNWNEDFEVMEGIKLNIEKFLEASQ